MYSQLGLEKHVLKALIQSLSLNILRGKKRVAMAEGSHVDFPSKRQQILSGDNGDFFEVVEVVDQPRQSQ